MTTVILERTFAAQIGLRSDQIRELRQAHLSENVDFEKNGRDILLSESGREKLRALLGLEIAQKKEGAGAQEAAPEAEDGGHSVEEAVAQAEVVVVPVTLYCVGLPLNSRVIHATAVEPQDWPANRGQLACVTVRVRNAEHFRIRMKLKAAPTSRVGVFDLLGRCPRFPGRY